MHDVAAGEVEHAPLAHEPAAPLKMGEGAVDDEMPDAEEDEEGPEAHALSRGAGDDGSGDDGERALEGHEQRLGDVAEGLLDVGEPELGTAADKVVGVVARPEGDGVAKGKPEHSDEARHGEALHHGPEHVGRLRQASVEEGEAGQRHHKHEAGADEDEGGVAAAQEVVLPAVRSQVLRVLRRHLRAQGVDGIGQVRLGDRG